MNGSQSEGTKVTVTGWGEQARGRTAVTSLSAAVERAVQAHRPPGYHVREVVVVLEASAPAAAVEPAPVYVDVYDSGYGHGI